MCVCRCVCRCVDVSTPCATFTRRPMETWEEETRGQGQVCSVVYRGKKEGRGLSVCVTGKERRSYRYPTHSHQNPTIYRRRLLHHPSSRSPPPPLHRLLRRHRRPRCRQHARSCASPRRSVNSAPLSNSDPSKTPTLPAPSLASLPRNHHHHHQHTHTPSPINARPHTNPYQPKQQPAGPAPRPSPAPSAPPTTMATT